MSKPESTPDPASSPCQAPPGYWDGEPHPASTALTLLVLKTPRIEAVRPFYEAIGVSFVEEKHGNGPVHYAGRVGETVIEVYPLLTGEPDKTTRLGFAVGDLGKVVAALKAIGTEVDEPKVTEWGLRVVVHDPHGRAVELYQRELRS
jgi:lactoylglutathione lyase